MSPKLQHIAIIMDGNGRWAEARGFPRAMGHRHGVDAARRIVEEAIRMDLQQLTLYCFSTENWKRPPEELQALMLLLKEFMILERKSLVEKNIRLKIIGRRDGILEDTLREMDLTVAETANNSGLTLCLAINYGGRQELADAARALAERVVSGVIQLSEIDESTLESFLYTHSMPDPDLLIRTAGELRISNFLLWQLSYSELWVTDIFWPDFEVTDFRRAVSDYSRRVRRFGSLDGARS